VDSNIEHNNQDLLARLLEVIGSHPDVWEYLKLGEQPSSKEHDTLNPICYDNDIDLEKEKKKSRSKAPKKAKVSTPKPTEQKPIESIINGYKVRVKFSKTSYADEKAIAKVIFDSISKDS
jgi:hypothetical protein